MSGLEKLQQQDRRLVILRLLMESDGYSANTYLLRSALEGFGHSIGMDLLMTEIAWLEEQGLVTTDQPGGVTVAKLTSRGHDAALGRATVPGVKKPEPGDH